MATCSRFGPALGRLSEGRHTDVYARCGCVVACPVHRSAEEHHLCPTPPFQTTESSTLATVSGTGASGFFRELHAAGGDVMGVDWRINIDQAWMDISYRSAIQGNLDPVALFAPLPELRAKVHELLKRTGTRPGHIFNLGHGILPETPVENVKAVVEMVREFRP